MRFTYQKPEFVKVCRDIKRCYKNKRRFKIVCEVGEKPNLNYLSGTEADIYVIKKRGDRVIVRSAE